MTPSAEGLYSGGVPLWTRNKVVPISCIYVSMTCSCADARTCVHLTNDDRDHDGGDSDGDNDGDSDDDADDDDDDGC